jgi:hypothetical protein
MMGAAIDQDRRRGLFVLPPDQRIVTGRHILGVLTTFGISFPDHIA